MAEAGRTQLRMAETEKYPHVTYFLNGGREEPYRGEDRIMVPSPKVATYDLQPEMSAPELTDKAVAAIDSGKYDLIILNYANPDMVGHTGNLAAAIKAVETVDTGLGRIAAAIEKAGGALLVTADHGNCELMRDPQTGGPHTAHTTNPVPWCCSAATTARWRRRPARRPRPDLARADGIAEAARDDGRVAAGGVKSSCPGPSARLALVLTGPAGAGRLEEARRPGAERPHAPRRWLRDTAPEPVEDGPSAFAHHKRRN